jgi:beta-lactamase class A
VFPRIPALFVFATLAMVNVACMAMEEGTYQVPGTPAPAPKPPMPVAPPMAQVSSARPAVLPTPSLPASTSSNPPVISSDCGVSTSSAARLTSEGRIASPQNVPGMRPFVLLPVREDAALRKKIVDRLGDNLGDFGVVVKDLNTGRGISINSEWTYFTASLFKVYVMLEVMHQEALGLLKLTDEVTITSYYDAQSVGPRLTALCQRLTIRQALEAMMARSDNSVAVLLQDLVGSGNINASMVSLGLKNSHFLSEDLPTSAADLAKVLEGIGRYQAVSKSASEEMVRLLSLEQFDNGLRAGTPPGLRIAHKTGNYQGVTHDAGIVYGPAGPYLIVVLSDGASPTGVTKDIATIVFDHFGATSPVARTP